MELEEDFMVLLDSLPRKENPRTYLGQVGKRVDKHESELHKNHYSLVVTFKSTTAVTQVRFPQGPKIFPFRKALISVRCAFGRKFIKRNISQVEVT